MLRIINKHKNAHTIFSVMPRYVMVKESEEKDFFSIHFPKMVVP